MGTYVANQGLKQLASMNKDIHDCRILVMGITFKENVSDIRNSKVADLVNEFRSFGITVNVTDPRASAEEVKAEYGLELIPSINGPYDAVVVAVNHNEYLVLDEKYFTSICTDEALFMDIKGIYRNRINKLKYWSL
jgi:UDP-N-acetyl-D-galactosamine dehydrogenase